MDTGSGGRKRVDLTTLPHWAQLLIAGATIAVVVAIALLVGRPQAGPTIPVSAIVAAVIAFAVVAWQAQHRR